MTIPETIKQARKDAGLTQKQLGIACGYEGRSGETMVQSWEYGTRPVPLEKLRILATTLGIPLDSLIP